MSIRSILKTIKHYVVGDPYGNPRAVTCTELPKPIQISKLKREKGSDITEYKREIDFTSLSKYKALGMMSRLVEIVADSYRPQDKEFLKALDVEYIDKNTGEKKNFQMRYPCIAGLIASPDNNYINGYSSNYFTGKIEEDQHQENAKKGLKILVCDDKTFNNGEKEIEPYILTNYNRLIKLGVITQYITK
ncbi:MAG: hypothetical protein HY094_09015 [Candidatus Melainabacteria bacterium]|nr:hypothetical protein [Candidatus Melainabacteria bacterium]